MATAGLPTKLDNQSSISVLKSSVFGFFHAALSLFSLTSIYERTREAEKMLRHPFLIIYAGMCDRRLAVSNFMQQN